MKFILGLLLGLTIGGVYFNHQVKKVEEYSFKIAYMSGRLDEAADTGDLEVYGETLDTACKIYRKHNYDTTIPFGYTTGPQDQYLKHLCLTPNQ